MIGVAERRKCCEFPISSHLRQLKLDAVVREEASPLVFSSMIKASPSLHVLELELQLDCHRTGLKRETKIPHHCLKVVEIVGSEGETVDTEFCEYLIAECHHA